MTVETITLGCRLNFAESETMKRAATGETTIINSCAVTAEAERQTRQAIRRARRERPGARIVVTGCAAQLSPEVYAAMPEVDLVLGNADKMGPNPFVSSEVETSFPGSTNPSTSLGTNGKKVRASSLADPPAPHRRRRLSRAGAEFRRGADRVRP